MNNVTRIKGTGSLPMFVLGLICCSRGAGRSVELNAAGSNGLIDAEDICKRNPNLVDWMLKSLESEEGGPF